MRFVLFIVTSAVLAAAPSLAQEYVESTAISFELEVPSVSEFAERINGAVERWSWLVAEVGGRPLSATIPRGNGLLFSASELKPRLAVLHFSICGSGASAWTGSNLF